MQERGFNGFSYADVATELGVTKASLHYHFPGRAELGEALIRRYTERFISARESIEAGQGDASTKLRSYAALYADVLRGRRMCLCGMMAAEYQTLDSRGAMLVARPYGDTDRFHAASNRLLGTLATAAS